MIKRITFAALLCLALFSSAQPASACQFCKFSGFVCGANGCEPVETCADPNFPKRGYSDCYFILSTCINGGESCVWAMLTEPDRPEQARDEKAS